MTSSDSPFFSVIIPVYNGEQYLRSAVQSVLDLGYPAMELIVVDDGSTDTTAEIITSLGDRVRCVRQPNGGPAAARNRGLQFARGQVVSFLDTDDLWTPNIITRALTILLSHPEVDIVQGRIQEIKPSISDATKAYEYLSKPYPYIAVGSAVYRRIAFEKIGGFDETLRFCEDYDWFLRAFDAFIPKVRIDDVTMLYRRHPGSMTYGKSLNEIGMARAHKKVIDRRRRNPGTTRKFPPDFPSLLEYIGSKAEVTSSTNRTSGSRSASAV